MRNLSSMNYKGYVGQFNVDIETGLIRGMVINTRDVITFHGKTVEEAQQAFRDSVDDYLEFCTSLGEAPDKPYSGKLLLRVNPQLHQKLHVLASSRGVSVNKFIARRLAAVARKCPIGGMFGTPVRLSDQAPVGKPTPVATAARAGLVRGIPLVPRRSSAPKPPDGLTSGAKIAKRQKTKVESGHDK